MSLGEQDELCRKAGWATVTEQQKYWEERDDRLLVALEEMRKVLEHLNDNIRLLCQRL